MQKWRCNRWYRIINASACSHGFNIFGQTLFDLDVDRKWIQLCIYMLRVRVWIIERNAIAADMHLEANVGVCVCGLRVTAYSVSPFRPTRIFRWTIFDALHYWFQVIQSQINIDWLLAFTRNVFYLKKSNGWSSIACQCLTEYVVRKQKWISCDPFRYRSDRKKGWSTIKGKWFWFSQVQ